MLRYRIQKISVWQYKPEVKEVTRYECIGQRDTGRWEFMAGFERYESAEQYIAAYDLQQ